MYELLIDNFTVNFSFFWRWLKINNGVNYIIISRPSYITFECPFCHEEVEVNFDEVDFNTDYWGDGAWCDCPECGEKVELDDYEYS